jgi:hypothetical protein
MADGFSAMNRKFFWTSLAIAAMWAAVALASILGPELVVTDGLDEVRIPASAVVVSFFAAVATIFVAVWGYRESAWTATVSRRPWTAERSSCRPPAPVTPS